MSDHHNGADNERMNPSKTEDGNEPDFDRRSLLRKSAMAAGGLTVLGMSNVAADKPDKYEIDVSGTTRFVPCLDEKLEITEGIWVILEDSQEKKGNCLHYNFHFHYKNGVTLEGQESGRKWTGQGTKNRNFTVCPPYPGQDTVTNRTTVTRKDEAEDKVVQLKLTAHVTVNANGDWTASFNEAEFSCRGKNTNEQ